MARVFWLLMLLMTPAFAQEAAPLAPMGDVERGRALVADRRKTFCTLCHVVPGIAERFMGNLAPPLNGTGSRWTAAEQRYRLIDSSRLNADTIMPAYYRSSGFTRVARQFDGQTLLTGQDIEDIVAFLMTLKE